MTALRDTFRDTAVPTVLYSDGGPQFASRFTQEGVLLREWGVRSVISSPHYPQSNGHAEISVKAMKKLIINCWDTRTWNVDMDKWAKGLLQWRNTPRIPGQSPAQVVFGHPARDTLPIHKRAFAYGWVKNQDCVSSKHQETVERHYNLTARPLPPLQCGNKIVIQNHCTRKWDTYGTIVKVGSHRDYLVKLPSGRVWRRNRRFLRKRYPVAMPPPAVNIHPERPPERRSMRNRHPPIRLIEEI